MSTTVLTSSLKFRFWFAIFRHKLRKLNTLCFFSLWVGFWFWVALRAVFVFTLVLCGHYPDLVSDGMFVPLVCFYFSFPYLFRLLFFLQSCVCAEALFLQQPCRNDANQHHECRNTEPQLLHLHTEYINTVCGETQRLFLLQQKRLCLMVWIIQQHDYLMTLSEWCWLIHLSKIMVYPLTTLRPCIRP
jgi:hypothetical protein